MNRFAIAVVLLAAVFIGGLRHGALASNAAVQAVEEDDKTQITLSAEDQEKLRELKALFAPLARTNGRIVVPFHDAPDDDNMLIPYDHNSLLDDR